MPHAAETEAACSTPDAQQARRAELCLHRNRLEDARLSASRDRDRTVLAIAGGSLTISVALLQRAGAIQPAQALLLGAGWLLEVLAISLVLWSISSGERALSSERERVDHMLGTGSDDPGWLNPSSERTERLNDAASVLAVVGVVLLLLQATVSMWTHPAGR